MTSKDKKELWEIITKDCHPHLVCHGVTFTECFPIEQVHDTIMKFESTTDADCRVANDSLMDELRKELDLWKDEAVRLNKENIKLMAIIRTVEQFTGKTLLD